MRTKLICPAISISIRGVDFPSNLILLDSKGIDIILGMDWLSNYDEVIECAKKAVRLTKKDETTVEFVAAVQAYQASMLSQMKVTALEEILVVQEYPDVFPEELPSMPPDHDIEFRCIDVIFFRPTGHYVRNNYSVLLNKAPVYHIVVVRVI
jgi:hypothetical protein